MKTISVLLLGGVMSVISLQISAQISIGGYNVYYGHLHNHCAYSDGKGSPATAYAYARDNGKLDFFSLADHEYALNEAEYTQMKKTADSINQPGVFTALYGFEWSHNTYGHVTVIGTSDYCLSGSSPTNTFPGLVNWLSSRECIAMFNHPGRQNSTGAEFSQFTTDPSDKFIGMELWNKTDRFANYYYNDGYYTGDGFLGYFDEALARGWKIGAAGSEDNHLGTWGTMTSSKMAVLALTNTRTEIMNALKNRRFYTTYDKTLALSFKMGENEMGSTIPGGTYQMLIQASDDSGDNFSQIQLLRNGVVVSNWTPGTNMVNITQTIHCFDGEYYYIRLKQTDGDEAISSPIWIDGGTVNNPPSINLTSPADNTVTEAMNTLEITAEAFDSDGSIAKVAFSQGNTLLGEDTSAPYSYSWSNIPAGVYKITAVATDNQGATTSSVAVTIVAYNPDGVNSRSVMILKGSDDAEESASGVMYMSSTDLELVYDSYNQAGNQTVGLRFCDLFIPQGATITEAFIQFTCDESTTTTCSLEIKGEVTDHAAPIINSSHNLSGRLRTDASVLWMPAPWTVVGESGTNQRTPDLSAIIQEIVNRPGYSPASALMILITGSGTRIAESFEGSQVAAPRLMVEYTFSLMVTPEFDPIGPIMQGSESPALPESSGNGITGSWDPAYISTEVPGNYIFTFTPDAGQNAKVATLDITVLPAALTITVGISSGNDDVEEYNSGAIILNSSDINMVYDSKKTGNQKVGLRFNGIYLPAGSTISAAYLQWTAFGMTTAATSLNIYGQASDHATPFTTSKKNVSVRAKTTASVKWYPSAWTSDGASGADQQSPDMKKIVQEIVDRPGWKPGNSMAFMITGTGTRSAIAYETSPRNAAHLVIEYLPYMLKSNAINPGSTDFVPEDSPVAGKLTCYPVPFKDKLYIRFIPEENEVMQCIRIYNLSGLLVKEIMSVQAHSEINLNEHPSGIYMVRVLTNQAVYVNKVYKK